MRMVWVVGVQERWVQVGWVQQQQEEVVHHHRYYRWHSQSLHP